MRRYYAFGHLDYLANPDQWPGLKMFGLVQSERTVKGKTSKEARLYIGSIPVNAKQLAHAVRSHWEVENRLHWCLDVCLNDDQARARVNNSACSKPCHRASHGAQYSATGYVTQGRHQGSTYARLRQ